MKPNNPLLVALALSLLFVAMQLNLSSIRYQLERIANNLERQTYLMQNDKCGGG